MNLLPKVNLGTGRSAKAISAGSDHTCAILDNDTVKCWGYGGYGVLGQGNTINRGDGANEMGDSLPAIELGSGRTAKAISASDTYHTCALLDDDSIKCWGDNIWGALGLGNTSGRGDAAGEMGDNLPTVNLGTGRTAQAVTTGRYHTCALLDDDSVKCWGQNNYGQLGQDDTTVRGTGANQMGDALDPVLLP
jgi:alpha-tubulin suppressor-like RCC1 family protein